MKNVHINQCVINLTQNCNLRCDFCYAKKTGYKKNHFIKIDNIKKIIDFCDEAKVDFIVLTGGEPILYPDIADVIKYIKTKKHEIKVAVTTNGTMLADTSFCKMLIESGTDYIDVSLKGINCENTVGYDCFPEQLKAIKNLSDLSVEMTCSMVLTYQNINNFCEAVSEAYKNGARQFSFTFVLDNDESGIKDLKYLISNNPLILIDSFISQIDKLNDITKGEWWVEYTFPLCIYTENQLSLLKGRLAAPCHIFTGNCITFDTEMNLLSCTMNFERKLGQFGQDFYTFDEYLNYIKKDCFKCYMENLCFLPSDYCRSCKLLEVCRGGCPIFWKNCSFESLMQLKKINSM